MDSLSLCLPGLSYRKPARLIFLFFFFRVLCSTGFVFRIQLFIWQHLISVNPNSCILKCQEFCYLMLLHLCSLLCLGAALLANVRRGEVEEVCMVRVGSKTGSGCLHIPGNHRSALFEAWNIFLFTISLADLGYLGAPPIKVNSNVLISWIEM